LLHLNPGNYTIQTPNCILTSLSHQIFAPTLFPVHWTFKNHLTRAFPSFSQNKNHSRKNAVISHEFFSKVESHASPFVDAFADSLSAITALQSSVMLLKGRKRADFNAALARVFHDWFLGKYPSVLCWFFFNKRRHFECEWINVKGCRI
jgi:hypothetical protein